MSDVLYIVLTLAFFGLCIAYVFMCDRIIGPDEAVVPARTDAKAARDGQPARR
jgi:hypothetical protein